MGCLPGIHILGCGTIHIVTFVAWQPFYLFYFVWFCGDERKDAMDNDMCKFIIVYSTLGRWTPSWNIGSTPPQFLPACVGSSPAGVAASQAELAPQQGCAPHLPLGPNIRSHHKPPLPIPASDNVLPSSTVEDWPSQKTISLVIEENHKQTKVSKASTLAVKIATEAVFGQFIMKKCTALRGRGLPGLPRAELHKIKKAIRI